MELCSHCKATGQTTCQFLREVSEAKADPSTITQEASPAGIAQALLALVNFLRPEARKRNCPYVNDSQTNIESPHL